MYCSIGRESKRCQLSPRCASPGYVSDATFSPDPPRATIVDTWPADVDDSAARMEWDWQPEYDAKRAFDEYLVPNISRLYER